MQKDSIFALKNDSQSDESTFLTPPEETINPLSQIRFREIIAVLLGIVLCDTTIYHGRGFAGLAVLVAGIALLFFFGSSNSKRNLWCIILLLLAIFTSLKLFWNGCEGVFLAGLAILLSLGAILAKWEFSVSGVLKYSFIAPFFGGKGIFQYTKALSKFGLWPKTNAMAAFLLPLGILIIFGIIFTRANPDLVKFVWEKWEQFCVYFNEWLPDIGSHLLFWGVTAWILVGLFRFGNTNDRPYMATFIEPETPARDQMYYAAYRNTLIAVIVLFSVYLVFEFKTLWFRDFEEGFYYAGYAHVGAAWLTVALALSSLVLSTIFRGSLFEHPRIGLLQNLAWCWSFLNIVLAVAVYHRLLIYIDFNGMTRMRVIGILGITAVLLGFFGVIVKIAKRYDFVWLVRTFMASVLSMTLLGILLPVDYLVHSYNVSRILKNDLAPAVQTSTQLQWNSVEGFLPLFTLIDCDTPEIADGIKATIVQEYHYLRNRSYYRHSQGYPWTEFQGAEYLFYKNIEKYQEELEPYLADAVKSSDGVKQFKDYVYRWY